MKPILDTHALVKNLTATGLKEKQAEEIVKAIIDTKIYDIGEMATKVDHEKILADLQRVKTNLLKWYIGTTLTALTVLATLFSSYFVGS